jgi:hypothetical protein
MLAAFCGLALIFAVDVSDSVDTPEYELQRTGIAQALQDPGVLRTINQQPYGRIVVSVIEWSSDAKVTVPWMIIDGRESAAAFGEKLLASERSSKLMTAIGKGIEKSIEYFDEVPCQVQERKIDVSGDGINNEGLAGSAFFDVLSQKNIVVNGLPILEANAHESVNDSLLMHYQEHVIFGPGAFMVVAEDFNDFARAIRQKLSLEIVMK